MTRRRAKRGVWEMGVGGAVIRIGAGVIAIALGLIAPWDGMAAQTSSESQQDGVVRHDTLRDTVSRPARQPLGQIAAAAPSSSMPLGHASHDSTPPDLPPWRFGTWLAGGNRQMIKTRLGRAHDRSLYIVALRADRPLRRFGQITVDYLADFIPLIVATGNREYTTVQLCHDGVPCLYAPGSYFLIPSRHTAYGLGIVPLGFRVRVPIAGPLQFAVGVSGGGTYFNRRIPDPDETRFNFTAEANIGFLVRTPLGGMSVGFRQHHLSNGDMGRVNPAIDSQLWFIGYER